MLMLCCLPGSWTPALMYLLMLKPNVSAFRPGSEHPGPKNHLTRSCKKCDLLTISHSLPATFFLDSHTFLSFLETLPLLGRIRSGSLV